MRKPVLVVLIIAGSLLLVGGGIYFRTRNKQSTTSSATTGTLPTSGAFPGSEGQVASSGQASSTAPSLTSFGEALAYFVRPNGDVLTVGLDGRVTLTTSASSTLVVSNRISNIVSGSFSADGKKILIKYGTEEDPRWKVYDLDKNSWRELSIDARDVVFSPRGEVVAYFARRLSGVTLTTLDLSRDSAKPVSLISLAAEDPSLSWQGDTSILFGERPSSEIKGLTWAYDLKSRTLRQLLTGSGTEILWGDQDRGLLSMKGSSKNALSLVGKGLELIQNFSFYTLPEKCAFSSATSTESIFCSVPRDTKFSTLALPDQYAKQAVLTSDDIVSIDLGNGALSVILSDPNLNMDANDMSIVNSKLYFINRWDNKLYRLVLQ